MQSNTALAPGQDGAKPVDVVITWVDDRSPGYHDQLKAHAAATVDLDPSRTRDNLDILRFGLRSLERHAPWVNRVYLLTCRPQVPQWLAAGHPRMTVVHHDDIMPAKMLPTFNSFAIISHMHLIPGLSENFIYLEDDMLFFRDVSRSDFIDQSGRPIVFERGKLTPRYETIRNLQTERPWNLALAESNRLLDEAYGPAQRRYVNHVPLWIARSAWQGMIDHFPAAFDATRKSRFRAAGNVAPEYLYPQLLLAEGRGVRADEQRLRESCGYVPLEDFWPVTAFGFWRIARRRPKWVTLNDNFGQHPNGVTERLARRFLSSAQPQPSRFERA
ncbi:hypothetical protein [Aestuariivirga sp.]|uniref:hypothetical protein n=1 Tax=Aestuariivirga sp. TaxID=2650926 RepID=UPI003BAA90C8